MFNTHYNYIILCIYCFTFYIVLNDKFLMKIISICGRKYMVRYWNEKISHILKVCYDICLAKYS